MESEVLNFKECFQCLLPMQCDATISIRHPVANKECILPSWQL